MYTTVLDGATLDRIVVSDFLSKKNSFVRVINNMRLALFYLLFALNRSLQVVEQLID